MVANFVAAGGGRNTSIFLTEKLCAAARRRSPRSMFRFAATLGLLTVTAVPEPSVMMLMGLGVGVLCFMVRRRRVA